MTDSEVKREQDSDSRKMIVVATGAALLIFLALVLFARSQRSQLNIIQIASVVFFTALLLRHGRTRESSLSESRPGSPANGVRWELLLAPLLSAGVYASVLSSYFIGDDYDTLFRFRSAPFEALADFAKRGLSGVSLRPAGFVTLILDYSIWRHDPFGYHLTNLLFHLISVLGIYFLCKNLGLDRETSASSSLIFSIMPIHPEAVVWISSRFDLMATCLIIWVAVLYLKFRRTGRWELYALALFLSGIAMLSKENAFMTPLLLLSLEYFAASNRDIKSAILPLLGFGVLAAATFGYRWIALGGIGGYADQNGSLAVYKVGFKTIEGLFLRAPSQLLLGLNWYGPHVYIAVVIASLTAAVMIVLALFYKPARSNKGVIRFCLAWMLIGYAPAHFLLLIGPGLTNSRILYLSSAGMAVILALLLSGIEHAAMRRALKFALILLLSLALSHNVASWRRVGDLSQELLTTLKRLVPDPPPQAQFVFHQMPTYIEGIFYHGTYYQSVNLTYNRTDLGARSEEAAASGASSAHVNPPDPRTIKVRWLGKTNNLIELVND
jgi:protein O-mannosyl-transferase